MTLTCSVICGQSSGWWFGTFFIFPYTGNVIIPTDEVIFFRGVGIPSTSYISLPLIHGLPPKSSAHPWQDHRESGCSGKSPFTPVVFPDFPIQQTMFPLKTNLDKMGEIIKTRCYDIFYRKKSRISKIPPALPHFLRGAALGHRLLPPCFDVGSQRRLQRWDVKLCHHRGPGCHGEKLFMYWI